MADGKKGFVLYADLIHTVSKLPDDKAGQLLKHILSYVNDENPETDDIIISIAFEPIKQQLKRDLKKYEEKKIQWSEAGKASAEARKQLKERQRSSTVVGNRSTDLTVNDNVSVKVNVKDINNKLLSEIKISDVPEDYKKYFKTVIMFWELFIDNLKELNINSIDLLKAKYHNWITPIRLMIEKKECDYKELAEIYKFLQTDKFWRQNIRSTEKLRQKRETLLINLRSIESDLKYKDEEKKTKYPGIIKTNLPSEMKPIKEILKK